jgi:hypothetical protein
MNGSIASLPAEARRIMGMRVPHARSDLRKDLPATMELQRA